MNTPWFYWLLLLPTVVGLHAQMIPDAPVTDFKLPMFGDNGYKIWDLKGKEGRYISPEQIDVFGMTLRVFSGDEKLIVETIIETPEATMLIRKNQAQGDSTIKITGSNYRIEGKEWSWDGSTQTARVRQDVRVIFRDKLSDILR